MRRIRRPRNGVLAGIAQPHEQPQPCTPVPLRQNPQQLLDHAPPRPPTAQRALAQPHIHINEPHGLQRLRRDKVRQAHEVVVLLLDRQARRRPPAAGVALDQLVARAVVVGAAGGGGVVPGGAGEARGREAVDGEGASVEEREALGGDALAEEEDGGRAETRGPGRGGLVGGGELGAVEVAGGGVDE